MTTPVHPTTTTGSKGELKAAVIFADIGWAPPVKLGQDIGTDFITFARDSAAPEMADAWDLGAPVLLQIKGSENKYLEPTDNRDGEPGWWFAESDTYHFDHWLSFGLPYLLVLVDVKSQVAYWAEVSGNAIEATGKGRKIFIPAAQKVDAENIEALTKVAVSRRKYTVEGKAWSGSLNDLGPASRLRNALVLPRLVAPHPNKKTANLTFEEAAAMIMRNRYSELVQRGQDGQCPKTGEWAIHSEWGWRFVHALHELMTDGASARFPQLAAEARHRFERDACLVVCACGAYTAEETSRALDVLVTSRATKPADLGWVLTHRAAFLLELDRPGEAAEAAKKALFALKSLDGDLSISAIRGGAASVLYSTAGFATRDIGAMITAQDNAGTWWRAQDISWALEKDLKLRFKGWAGGNSVHFINSTASSDLAILGWNAAFTGAWGFWRHITTVKAQLAFTSSHDPLEAGGALAALIQVGEKEAAKEAATKMWREGPLAPLQSIVNSLAERPWSVRAEGATMAVLAAAGDLLTRDAAAEVIDRVLDLVRVNGDVRVQGWAWSDRWSEIDRTLPQVLKAATGESHGKVADLIADNFATCTEAKANSLVRIALSLATADLGTTRLNRLVEAATIRSDHYSIGLLEVLAFDSPIAQTELRARAEAGDEGAFRSLLVAGSQEHDDYIALGRSAARTVKKMVVDARGKDGQTTVAFYSNDPLEDLTLAALNTDDTDLWKEVTDALEECIIEETQQQAAIRMLASRFPSLPPHVQHKLRDLAPNIRGTRLGITLGQRGNEFATAVLQLRIAAGVIPDIEVEALLLAQLRSDSVGFITTLEAWNAEHKFPFLATMVVDERPQVRSQAAYNLIEHAYRYPADQERAHAVLRTALIQDQGCSLRDAVAQGLVAYPDEKLASLEAELRSHPSAVIRSRFIDDQQL